MKKHYQEGFKGTTVGGDVGYSRKTFMVALVHELGPEANMSDALKKVIDYYIKSQPEPPTIVVHNSDTEAPVRVHIRTRTSQYVPESMKTPIDNWSDNTSNDTPNDTSNDTSNPRFKLSSEIKSELLRVLDENDIGSRVKLYMDSYAQALELAKHVQCVNNYYNQFGAAARGIVAVDGDKPYVNFKLSPKTTYFSRHK